MKNNSFPTVSDCQAAADLRGTLLEDRAPVRFATHANAPCVVNRLEIGNKLFLDADTFVGEVSARLEGIQKALFDAALKLRTENIREDIIDFAAFKAYFSKKSEFIQNGGPGFVRAKWCGDEASEALLTEMAVTIRCLPFDQSGTKGKCVLTGKDATLDAIFARSY